MKRIKYTFIQIIELVVTLVAFVFACFPSVATEYFGLSANFPYWSWNLVRFYVITLLLLSGFVLLCAIVAPESIKPVTKGFIPEGVSRTFSVIKLMMLVVSGHLIYSVIYGLGILNGMVFASYYKSKMGDNK